MCQMKDDRKLSSRTWKSIMLEMFKRKTWFHTREEEMCDVASFKRLCSISVVSHMRSYLGNTPVVDVNALSTNL